jgi:hypothetical protein
VSGAETLNKSEHVRYAAPVCAIEKVQIDALIAFVDNAAKGTERQDLQRDVAIFLCQGMGSAAHTLY